MICPVCKQRWAGWPEEDFKFVSPHGKIKMFFSRITFNFIKRNGYYPKHEEAGFNRGYAFGINDIRCCEDSYCLQFVKVLALRSSGAGGSFKTYDNLVEETKKELAEGKIR